MKKMIPVYALQIVLILTCWFVGTKISRQLSLLEQRMAENDDVKTRRLDIEPFNPSAVRVKIVER